MMSNFFNNLSKTTIEEFAKDNHLTINNTVSYLNIKGEWTPDSTLGEFGYTVLIVYKIEKFLNDNNKYEDFENNCD